MLRQEKVLVGAARICIQVSVLTSPAVSSRGRGLDRHRLPGQPRETAGPVAAIAGRPLAEQTGAGRAGDAGQIDRNAVERQGGQTRVSDGLSSVKRNAMSVGLFQRRGTELLFEEAP